MHRKNLIILKLLSLSYLFTVSATAYPSPLATKTLLVANPEVKERLDLQKLRSHLLYKSTERIAFLSDNEALAMHLLKVKIHLTRNDFENKELTHAIAVLKAKKDLRDSALQDFENFRISITSEVPTRPQFFLFAKGIVRNEVSDLQRIVYSEESLPTFFPEKLKKLVTLEHAKLLATALKANRSTMTTRVKLETTQNGNNNICYQEVDGREIAETEFLTPAGTQVQVNQFCYDGFVASSNYSFRHFQNDALVKLEPKSPIDFSQIKFDKHTWTDLEKWGYRSVLTVQENTKDSYKIRFETPSNTTVFNVSKIFVERRSPKAESFSFLNSNKLVAGIGSELRQGYGYFQSRRISNLSLSPGQSMGVVAFAEFAQASAEISFGTVTQRHVIEKESLGRDESWVVAKLVASPSWRLPAITKSSVSGRFGASYMHYSDAEYSKNLKGNAFLITYGVGVAMSLPKGYRLGVLVDADSPFADFSQSFVVTSLRLGQEF